VLAVSRSGFYAWLGRPASPRALEDRRLCARIRTIHKRSRGTYGARRVHVSLRREGIRVSRKRVERLMRSERISGLLRRRRGRTTIRVPGVRTAPDLVERDFNPTAPDQLWCADITYLRTWEGSLYLAGVLDCFSRRLVGWSMRDDLRAELVVDALEMALARRRPGPGLVHHSDQGSQYTALVFGQRCSDAGVELSMGRRGCAYDNAVKESFFATLKKDLVHRRSWPRRQELRTAVFDYIETFYNPVRLHSTLGYLSPAEYERRRAGGLTVPAGATEVALPLAA
jgi:putative transposase